MQSRISPDYNINWSNSIRDYSYKYSNNPYKMEYNQRSINRMISDSDRAYNPILQKYNDPIKEKQIRQIENNKLINNIAKYQDNNIRKEQTFNIINLQDKLKGLEGDPNYPKSKMEIKQKNNLMNSRLDYNIISNIPLSEYNKGRPTNK